MAEPGPFLISVIICTRNRAESLRETLRSVTASIGLPPSSYEILVVDNGSRDQTRAVVDSFRQSQGSQVRYVFERRAGLSRARNAGLRASSGEVVVFTDDDCLVEPSWLWEIHTAFTTDQALAVLAGRVRPLGNAEGMRGMLSLKEREEVREFAFPQSAFGFGNGNNFSFRRALLARVGGFDEVMGAGRFIGGAEDVDFYFRVHIGGGVVRYSPRPTIWHKPRTSEAEAWRTYFKYAAGRGAFYVKHALRGDRHALKMACWELLERLRGPSDRPNDAQAWRRWRADVFGVLAGAAAWPFVTLGDRVRSRLKARGSRLRAKHEALAPSPEPRAPSACSIQGPSDRPRLLIISPLVPFPADEGRKRRQSAIIRALAKRFTITLVTFGDPRAHSAEAMTREGLAEAIVLDRNAARGRRRPAPRWLRHLEYWSSIDPWFVRERDSEELAAWLQGASATRWRAVIVFNMPVTGNLRHWLTVWQQQGIPVILDGDDYESAKQWRLVRSLPWSAQRLKQWVEWARIRGYERNWFSRFSQVWVCHEDDAQALRRRGRRNVMVVPNTVERPADGTPNGAVPSDVVFVGQMGYVANVNAVDWFVRQVWPRIRARHPEARFAVVGKQPAAEIRALDGRDGILVTGSVPDVTAYLRAAKVVVIPMQLGGGTRIKTLDAFASGSAVVSTTVGVEGLDVRDGQEALVADAPEAFAQRCLQLLDDSARRQRLGQAARRLVESRYSPATLDARLRELVPSEGPR